MLMQAGRGNEGERRGKMANKLKTILGQGKAVNNGWLAIPSGFRQK
jgi:hypothetical protein